MTDKPFTYSPTDPIVVDQRHVELGRRLCERIMAMLTKEDPQTALWALLLALPMTTKANNLQVWETFEVLRQFDRARATYEADASSTRGVLVTK